MVLERKKIGMNKKGQLATGLVNGLVGLIIGVIIAFVVVSQITGANLLTADSAEDNATDNLVANFTSGVDEISSQVVTFFTIVAVVILLGFLAILVINARRAQPAGGGSL